MLCIFLTLVSLLRFVSHLPRSQVENLNTEITDKNAELTRVEEEVVSLQSNIALLYTRVAEEEEKVAEVTRALVEKGNELAECQAEGGWVVCGVPGLFIVSVESVATHDHTVLCMCVTSVYLPLVAYFVCSQ